MANRKKRNPRVSFVVIRVTKREKYDLLEASMEENLDFSVYIRKLLNLNEDNN